MDWLSVSFSPLINIASLAVDPGILASPDMRGGAAVYPPLTHTGYHWGGGVPIRFADAGGLPTNDQLPGRRSAGRLGGSGVSWV